jgi:hypothetical protein
MRFHVWLAAAVDCVVVLNREIALPMWKTISWLSTGLNTRVTQITRPRKSEDDMYNEAHNHFCGERFRLDSYLTTLYHLQRLVIRYTVCGKFGLRKEQFQGTTAAGDLRHVPHEYKSSALPIQLTGVYPFCVPYKNRPALSCFYIYSF